MILIMKIMIIMMIMLMIRRDGGACLPGGFGGGSCSEGWDKVNVGHLHQCHHHLLPHHHHHHHHHQGESMIKSTTQSSQ